MKLTFSEAILIGDSLKSPDPRFFLSPDGSQGCAIGGAALAVGIRGFIAHPTSSPEFMAAFPWVTFAHCADISLQYDLVCKGWETIEQLADFVRSIEPTDSSAPILSAGSGEDGLPCDSSPLSQVSCGASEGCVGGNGSPATVSQRHDDGLICPEGVLKAPPAGIHFAGERAATGKDDGTATSRKANGRQINEARQDCGSVEADPVIPQVSSVKAQRATTSPAIHILPSRKPLVLSQSTVGILDAYQEEIEAEREGSDLGGYPDPADNPYAGVRL